MSKYLFYPGCSMERNARAYLDSLMAIRQDMDLEFEDVKDWNCCGATEYSSVYRIASHAVVSRNLALAEMQSNGTNTVAAGCSACYLNLSKTNDFLRNDPRLKNQVDQALAAGGLHYTPDAIQIRHLLDIIYNDVGMERISEKVTKPLTGLRVAPYYGCMIVRPDVDKRFDNPEYPTQMDKLIKVLGAEVIDYPLKTHCCGGHMTQISEATAFELIRRLLYAAEQYRADIMVTLCPMCQLNLDAYQHDVNNMFKTSYDVPILYFTQLIGLAFGHSAEELGLGREFVSPAKALAKVGVEVPVEEPRPVRRRKDDPSLPMPSMPVNEEEVQ